MNVFKHIFSVSIVATLLATNITFAQTQGDEDAEMSNKAKARDQKAIDEAKNGWWTASMKTHEQRIAWWRDAKFGMFIHWGVYSLPGGEWKGKKVGGYAEHLMRKEKITRADYIELANQFNPAKFNAEEWILHAKKAGMRYFIITAKHHDGFAMFDSKVSDFDIIDKTPFRRDPMAELAAAARKHGVKFGFYYSHAFDWEHPDAPGNDWEYNNPGGDKLLGTANWFDTHPEWLPKAQKYVDEKAIPQIKELLTKYHPDILWFDTPHKLPLSENIRILKAIRETDANLVVNGRLVRSGSANFGDYKNTADRPAEFYPVTGDWEAIPTTNESYRYSKYDSSHKSVRHFIQLISNAASRGGNLLMNIGPKGDGAFDTRDLNILKGIGKWLDKNGESIYGPTASILPLQSWGVSTLKGNKLYLHIHQYPADGRLYVGGLKSTPAKVYLLADQKQLTVTRINDKDVVINLPRQAPDTINTVVVVELNGRLAVDTIRYVSVNIPITRLLAFDADLQGSGFQYGDGKAASYHVGGWRSMNQKISWRFRTGETDSFKVVIKYSLSPESGGIYQMKVGPRFSHTERLASVEKGTVVQKEIGTGELPAGLNEISIYPTQILKPELMKLFEVQLIPVKK